MNQEFKITFSACMHFPPPVDFFIAICLIRKDHRKINELKSLLIFFILLTSTFYIPLEQLRGKSSQILTIDDMDMYTLSSGDSSCISSSITGICHIEV